MQREQHVPRGLRDRGVSPTPPLKTLRCSGLRLQGKGGGRGRGERDYRLQYSREKLTNMGDDHPSF